MHRWRGNAQEKNLWYFYNIILAVQKEGVICNCTTCKRGVVLHFIWYRSSYLYSPYTFWNHYNLRQLLSSLHCVDKKQCAKLKLSRFTVPRYVPDLLSYTSNCHDDIYFWLRYGLKISKELQRQTAATLETDVVWYYPINKSLQLSLLQHCYYLYFHSSLTHSHTLVSPWCLTKQVTSTWIQI